jgi:hypothetical protein
MMFFCPLAHLSGLAGGMSPFDIRSTADSYDEAHAFLNAIGEQGRRYYVNRELPLDMFYPPLYAISRGVGAMVADDAGAPARYSYAAQLALRPHCSPDHHGGP